MLSFYAASSQEVNAQKAIKQAIEKAIPTDKREDCRLLVFHSSIAHNFNQMLTASSELLPNAEVVGCTAAGIISVDGANETMRALGIMAICTDNPDEIVVSKTDAIFSNNSKDAGKQLAESIKAKNKNVNMLMSLASGFDIDAGLMLDGIATVFGAETPVFGGTSSDNMKVIKSMQFYNEDIYENGAVLVGFADESLKIHTGVHHGSVKVGLPFEVTKAEGNRIYEINGERAWDFLMKKLNFPIDTPPGDCVAISGLGINLPKEYQEDYDNEHLVMAIIKVLDDNSFMIPISVENGTQMWLTERNEDLIFDGLDRMLGRLTSRIGEEKPVAVFHTDCGARGRLLLNMIMKDEIIGQMQEPFFGKEPLPWLGMYGFGEFTPVKGRNLFHNYTTSLYVMTRA